MSAKQKRGGKDAGLEELAAASLEAAWRFPPAQRLFILFLEAADSHRLNRSLLRQVMQGRMHVRLLVPEHHLDTSLFVVAAGT